VDFGVSQFGGYEFSGLWISRCFDSYAMGLMNFKVYGDFRINVFWSLGVLGFMGLWVLGFIGL